MKIINRHKNAHREHHEPIIILLRTGINNKYNEQLRGAEQLNFERICRNDFKP